MHESLPLTLARRGAAERGPAGTAEGLKNIRWDGLKSFLDGLIKFVLEALQVFFLVVLPNVSNMEDQLSLNPSSTFVGDARSTLISGCELHLSL